MIALIRNIDKTKANIRHRIYWSRQCPKGIESRLQNEAKLRGLRLTAKKLYKASQDADHGKCGKANSKCHGVAHDETKANAAHYQYGFYHCEYCDCPTHYSLPSIEAGFMLLLPAQFGKINDAIVTK
jgi:hypothetical protein